MSFNARPAAHSLGIAICAEGVVAFSIFIGIVAVVSGIWP